MIRSTLLFILFVTASKSQDYYSKARNFSIELIYFTQDKTNHEVVLAPFGIWSLMGQIAFASEGVTRNELKKTLILGGSTKDSFMTTLDKFASKLEEPSDGAIIFTKNLLFRDQPLKVSLDFVTRIQQMKGTVWSVDFGDFVTSRLVNSIIKTINFTIPVFGASDFKETDLIFSNVFSFKGKWSTPFNRSNTYLETSFDRSGKPFPPVSVMSQKMRVPFSDIKKLKATATELSFGTDGIYCMLIIRPYDTVSVADVYKQLSSVTLKDIFDQLQREFNDVEVNNKTVRLPRFEKQSFLVLNAPLNDMGIVSLFNPDKAQFASLSEDQLFVETIEQRAKISVSEEGVDAFATIPANLEISTITKPYNAKPFIFFIVHKSTMSIVMGGIYGKS